MHQRRPIAPSFIVERKRRFPMPEGRDLSNLRRFRPPGGDDRADEDAAGRPRALSADQIVEKLTALAERARRLRPPMSSNLDAFHEDKSDLARDLTRLAEAIRIGPSRHGKA